MRPAEAEVTGRLGASRADVRRRVMGMHLLIDTPRGELPCATSDAAWWKRPRQKNVERLEHELDCRVALPALTQRDRVPQNCLAHRRHTPG
jgi:hypothetical protein